MKRILIIEDEAAFREAIAFALEGEGYRVLQAENGIEGIELARTQSPDLIISDIMMDSVDGFEAVLSLRQDPRTTNVPVILMTGKANKEGLVHAIELGANDYLSKPFTIPELFEAINACFSKQDEKRRKEKERASDPRSSLTLGLPGELRTPLAGIIGFSKALSREYVETKQSETIELGRAIQKAARNAMRVAENFSILAQTELLLPDDEKVRSLREFKTADAQKLVKNIAEQVAEQHERSDDLSLSLAPGGAKISEEYLQKILYEVIDNAFKFSSKGQKVTVASSSSNVSYSVHVVDLGRGMSAQEISNINSHATLGSRFRDDRYFGWGLAVARRLAELHGGTVELSSSGSGVSVKATLPL